MVPRTPKFACKTTVPMVRSYRPFVDRNLTILIAEDDNDYAFFLERAFRVIGLKNPIRILPDGAEVVAYLAGEGEYADRHQFPLPSVVFTDLKMPRSSGFEVLEWMQKNPDCGVIPRIVLSSSDNEQDIARAYDLGAHAYLAKPGRLPDLESILRLTRDFWARCLKPPMPAVPASAPRDRSRGPARI
jgi:CheY-like chemotaxis protein